MQDSNAKVKNVSQELLNRLYNYYGYYKIIEIYNKNEENITDERTLDELLQELNDLVGLERVKIAVNNLIALQKVKLIRKNFNLNSDKQTLHLAFLGNPGTGKTTVARIVGRVYKHLGLLSKGHFIEASRTDLIAGYQGQTAIKVREIIAKAKGGVLFIDEAYSITENEHSDSYGRECLTELTKALEDYRDDLVVIVAGYTENMETFFSSNNGIKSRFNTFIYFEDYNNDELIEILIKLCKENDYVLAKETKNAIKNCLEKQESNDEDDNANGRMMRNIYEKMIVNHAVRLTKKDDYNVENLTTLLPSDFLDIFK